MVYSIVYDALKTKTTLFAKPAPLINVNEVACAIRMGYSQAGLEAPTITLGETVEVIRNRFLDDIKQSGHEQDVNVQLLTALKDYPHETAVVDEMAKETYDFGGEYYV